MAKKTNKTSHVLSLITGSQPPVAPSGETQQEGSAAEEPVRVPSANVTVVDPREEGKLAEEIQKNLIRELEKEQTEEQAEQPREQEEQSEEQTERSEEQTEQPNEQAEQTQEQTEQPQTNAGTPVQKEPEQQEEQKQEDRPSYRVVNIMEEILTPELILDALKSNDTCTCSRCQADVKALMLTRLPPKYIVADNTAVPMLLTYYHNRFRVAVLSQSIRACMDVKERPRHIL
ncbi:late competence development ComFB family protein [Enterocloster sp.]|uniref:late competence development ComFB family protein n=1 Tax=Enterocloster sp. TaxID=2719315 RepID=UPI00388FD531